MKKSLILLLVVIAVFYLGENAEALILQPCPDDGLNATIYYSHSTNLANNNYGNEPIMIIENLPSQNDLESRGLLKFNLPISLDGIILQKATLSLYMDNCHFDGSYPHNGIYVNRVASSWDEMFVTWNTRPSVDNLFQASSGQLQPINYEWINFDITDIANLWLTNPSENYGVEIANDEAYPYDSSHWHNSKWFITSDNNNDLLRPKLALDYYVIPEPSSLLLSLFGLLGVMLLKRKNR